MVEKQCWFALLGQALALMATVDFDLILGSLRICPKVTAEQRADDVDRFDRHFWMTLGFMVVSLIGKSGFIAALVWVMIYAINAFT